MQRATFKILIRMKPRNLVQYFALTCCVATPALAYISEPDTTVYGRIVNRSGAVDQVLTEGTLTWKLKKPDGTELLLNGSVGPLSGGAYSYTMSIPHQALSLGQQTIATVVGLGTGPSTQQLSQITYNGQPAQVMAPGSAQFDVLQAQRGSALRIDLEVNIPQIDTDHDGIPDWWEMANGLDKQSAADALQDADGDGRNNLAEYLANTDPTQDSRAPKLLTTEVVAYSQSTSVVLLETADLDSTAAQLTYTVTSAPASGALYLRNAHATPVSPDQMLHDGSTFTQNDVNGGRLVYILDQGNEPASFSVRVADESPAHAVAEGSVRILIYEPVPTATPSTAKEALSLAAFRAAAAESGPIIADMSSQSGPHTLAVASGALTPAAYTTSYVPAYGEDRSHHLFGGAGKDTLVGGAKGDVINGGAGDDQLSGKGGADQFIYTSNLDGNDTILDFTPQDGDKIDIAALLNGPSKLITDYIRITRSGADALLGINFNGTSSGYNEMVIRLAGSPVVQADIRFLVDSGNLITGPIGLPAQVNILAAIPRASENGGVAGRFTVSRGRVEMDALTVALPISGSATNGVAYALLQPSVVIPAGAASVDLDITPYTDAITELDETVQVSVVAQTGYDVGSNSTAQVVIDDLKPQITIEPLNSLAEINTQVPGSFLLARTGVLDRSVLVRLIIGGNATNGTDYNRIDSFFNLAANQTSGVIQIVPKATATLSRGAESVTIAVKPDTTYYVGNPALAEVVIVPEELSLATWRGNFFGGNNQTLDNFAKSDPDGQGLPMLVRYGFGLNPTNPRLGSDDLLPRPEMRNGHLALCFRRSPAARDVQYQVEVSDDMKTWHTSTGEVEDISLSEPVIDPTSVVYRSVDSVEQKPSRYMRVRLVRTQP